MFLCISATHSDTLTEYISWYWLNLLADDWVFQLHWLGLGPNNLLLVLKYQFFSATLTESFSYSNWKFQLHRLILSATLPAFLINPTEYFTYIDRFFQLHRLNQKHWLNLLTKLTEWFSQGATCFSSKDERGWTVLHNAAAHGRMDVVQWLSVKLHDLDVETPTGYTAMHLASLHGHTNCMVVRALSYNIPAWPHQLYGGTCSLT